MIIQCYIDHDTEQRLKMASEELGRTVEELAEAAIQEASIQYEKSKHL